MSETVPLSHFDDLLREIVERWDRETPVCLCDTCCAWQAVLLTMMGGG